MDDFLDDLFGQSGDDMKDEDAEYRDVEEDEPRASSIPQSKALRLVNAVADNDVVQQLETQIGGTVLDEAAQRQYYAVLGMVPINLMDKRVQARYIQANPEYAHAFKSTLMKGFLQGITSASVRMCNGIMLAAISRCLLDEVLSRMGLNSSARSDLISLAIELQRRMVDISGKTQQFVETMAITTREMGKVATLLEYGANTDLLLGKMREISIAIDERTEELKQAEETTLEPLIQATVVIQQYLQSDTKFQDESARLEGFEVTLRKKEEDVVEIFQKFWDQRTQLEARFARGKQQLSNLTAMRAIVKRQVDRCQDNLKQMDGVVSRYQSSKAEYQDDHRKELQSNRQMLNDLKTSMKNVAESRVESYKEQLSSLSKQRAAFGKQALSLRERSLHASDGFHVRETTTETSGLWGICSSSETHVETVQGPNEKLRMQEMARESQANYDELTRQISEVEEGGGRSIIKEMKELMESNVAQLKMDEYKEGADRRLQSNLESVDVQIDALMKLQENVQNKLESGKVGLENLMGQQKELEAEKKETETRLLELKSDEGSLKKQMELAQSAEKQARLEWTAQKEVVDNYVATFGAQNDFAVFMRLFGLLNGSVKNLPIAMDSMSKAFKGAELTFGHDIFRENLSSLPEAGQRRLLQDVATDMQNVCVIAWDTFEAPLIKLIQSDTRAVLDPIVRSRRMKEIMTASQKMNDTSEESRHEPNQAPAVSGPIIEESD